MQNIALISSIDNLSVGKLRADGYLKALENNGIAINSSIIIRTDAEELTGKIEKYFENKIDGIFAIEENDSVTALRLALKKGFKVQKIFQ
jgi:LacI family transcriptional regulator